MEDASIASPIPAPSKTPIVLLAAQWVVASFLAWMAIRSIRETAEPTVLLWMAVGCVAIAAIAHSPPVFFRASFGGRYGIYIALPASLLFLGLNQNPPRPLTAQEIASRTAERNSREATERREQDVRNAEVRKEKLKRCFSWRGQIGSLIDEIKGQLHNPHSFEHVQTTIIGNEPYGDNVEMSFRAENGFGALRTGTARATVDPSNCETKSTWMLSDAG